MTTLPACGDFTHPVEFHGSYWHYWGTEQEVAWKRKLPALDDFYTQMNSKIGGGESR